MRNAVGDTLSMPRNAVDEDKNRTCSAGLHFCSYSYLPHFGGERIVVVKINPRDVVAIPADYNNAKGRTCRYEVVEELAVEKNGYSTLPVAPLPENFTDSHGSLGDDGDDADEDLPEMTDEEIADARDNLSHAEERNIRDAYFEESVSAADLADDYDVPEPVIHAILNDDPRSSSTNAEVKVAASAPRGGKPNTGNSLTDAQVREIRRLLNEDYPLASIAKIIPTSSRTVARIRDGETYTHVK